MYGYLRRRLEGNNYYYCFDSCNTGFCVKNFYIFIAVAIVITILSVLFVPGVDDYVERIFQIYLGRAAS
jgi:hypothetical protein